MQPRVPSSARDIYVAHAELFTDFGETHIEVAGQDVDTKASDPVRQSIPEVRPYLRPTDLHGVVVPMHCSHLDFPPQIANVLLESDFTR